jgi:hypothetical protein
MKPNGLLALVLCAFFGAVAAWNKEGMMSAFNWTSNCPFSDYVQKFL